MRWQGAAARAALASLAVTGAWAQAGPPVVPPLTMVTPKAPQAPQAEVIPPPPSGREKLFVWQPDQSVARPSERSTWVPRHWQWTGQSPQPWLWVSGQYEQVPAGHRVRVPGRWVQVRVGGWAWTEGHWAA